MKGSKLLASLLIFTLKMQAQPTTLQFQINGSGLSRDVGIRGNIAPLSWEKTFLLSDKDDNGIYAAGIIFPNLFHGTVVEYKFLSGFIKVFLQGIHI